MNTYTDAEKFSAETIAQSVRELSGTCVSRYAALPDREAAAEALRARVAEMLLGDAFVVVPRYVLEGLRKQLEDVQ